MNNNPVKEFRISPVKIELIETIYIISLIFLVPYLGVKSSQYYIPIGWSVFWSLSLLVLALTPRYPWLGLFIFVILAYLTPRYSKAMDILLELNLLNWACALTIAGWLLWSLRNHTWPPIKNKYCLLMLLFVGWIALTLIVSIFTNGFLQPFPKHHPIQYAQGLLMFLLAAQFMNQKKIVLSFALIICLSLVIRTYIQGTKNIYLASDIPLMMALAMPFALLGGVISSQTLTRLCFGLMGIVMLYVIVIAQNRASAVAFAAMVLLLCWQYRRMWRYVLPGLIILILLVPFISPKSYWNRFQVIWDTGLTHDTASLDRGTIDQRLKLWKAGIQMTSDNPIFGVGPGNYPHYLRQYAKLSSRHLPSHNNFINIAAETGIFGLCLYVALFGYGLNILRMAAQSEDVHWSASTARMLIISICGYLTVGLFISRQDMVLAYLLLGWALALAPKRTRYTDLTVR